jgi:hypothetical protein
MKQKPLGNGMEPPQVGGTHTGRIPPVFHPAMPGPKTFRAAGGRVNHFPSF